MRRYSADDLGLTEAEFKRCLSDLESVLKVHRVCEDPMEEKLKIKRPNRAKLY